MTFELLFFAVFAGGWVAGRLFEAVRLPGVLGMTLFGVALAVVVGATGDAAAGGSTAAAAGWPPGFWDVAPFIKSLALVVILLRAGLGISKNELRRAGLAALLMAFVPCLVEGAALTVVFVLLFGFSWPIAGLTGFMLAAVSPAVVVPSMLDLRARGIGTRSGVITVVLAGASVDDVVAITLFTLFLSLAQSPAGALANAPWLGPAWLPVSLIGGMVAGLALGWGLAWWFKRHHTRIRATEKSVLVLASAVFLVQVGAWLHVAALLGVMAAGFVLLERAEHQAHELAAKLAKAWVFAQIALFVIIGMSIDVPTAIAAGPRALAALAIGLAARSVGVWLATWPSALNYRERLFCVIAYLPKATVQAALGGVALTLGLPHGQTIVAVAVLAIVVTAPLGLIGIRLAARWIAE